MAFCDYWRPVYILSAAKEKCTYRVFIMRKFTMNSYMVRCESLPQTTKTIPYHCDILVTGKLFKFTEHFAAL